MAAPPKTEKPFTIRDLKGSDPICVLTWKGDATRRVVWLARLTGFHPDFKFDMEFLEKDFDFFRVRAVRTPHVHYVKYTADLYEEGVYAFRGHRRVVEYVLVEEYKKPKKLTEKQVHAYLTKLENEKRLAARHDMPDEDGYID